MSMEVRIEQRQPCTVAAVRHVGPYTECCGAWKNLMAWAGPKGLAGPQAQFIGICYDDPDQVPADQIRYDASVLVSDDIQPEGEVQLQQIAGGTYAVATHCGPYENLKATYEYIYGPWMAETGKTYRPLPCFEIYLNCPETTAPEDLRTEVYVPIEE